MRGERVLYVGLRTYPANTPRIVLRELDMRKCQRFCGRQRGEEEAGKAA